MDNVREYLGEYGDLAQAVVVVVLVAVILTVLRKALTLQDQNVSGNQFRNQLVMFASGFVGLLAIILGLPLDASVRGQLLTLIGILVSAAIALSGSTFLSNAMAGIMLKIVNSFRTGDFIKTDEHFGRVTERGLFHTEIQTPDRDLTTLPNLLLASQAVKVVRQSGTIVSATVSLGYDVPHNQVENLLVEAAEKIGLSEPFVQVLDLGDFSVTYRTAGLLTETKQLIAFKSRLRCAILDVLHTAGVEIVSPDFTNARVYQPQEQFIPQLIRRPVKDTPKDAAPVDVVFDKAEDAESLSLLRQNYDTKDTELKDVRKALKAASTDEEKQTLEAQIAYLERVKVSLQKAISIAEERESQHD